VDGQSWTDEIRDTGPCRPLSTLEAFTFSDEPTVREKAIANIKLMREFLQTIEADVAATKAELAEDRGELTEDRRERREDRRERRERRRNG
jgi:hypothetical protein